MTQKRTLRHFSHASVPKFIQTRKTSAKWAHLQPSVLSPPATSARKKSSNPRVAKSLQRARRFMIFLAAPPARRTHPNIYHSLSRLAAPKQKCTPNVFFPQNFHARNIMCVWWTGRRLGVYHIYHWARTFAHSQLMNIFCFVSFDAAARAPCMLCTWARL